MSDTSPEDFAQRLQEALDAHDRAAMEARYEAMTPLERFRTLEEEMPLLKEQRLLDRGLWELETIEAGYRAEGNESAAMCLRWAIEAKQNS